MEMVKTTLNQAVAFAGPAFSALAISCSALAQTPARDSESKSVWGEPVEGFSVHLSAKSPVWDFREPRFFSFTARNRGTETLTVARSEASGELEVDGVWCKWLFPVIETPSLLVPGQEFQDPDLTISSFQKEGRPVPAGPGKHIFRFAVIAHKPNGAAIRAVSNPVEVEFRWAADATKAPLAFTAPRFPVPAYHTGHVVDDETDAPITNFYAQEGFANPPNPEAIAWSQSFRGPIISGPLNGGFTVEMQKQGQAWRILASGYLPQIITEHPFVAPVEKGDLVVRMKRGGELRGVVLDGDGHAMVGARILLTTEQTPKLTDGRPEKTFMGSTATTDAAGRFALRGVGAAEPKVMVVSPDGLQTWPAPKYQPGRELTITQPKPGALIVRYDIAGDEPEAELHLALRSSEIQMPGWTELKPKVANGGEIVLTNLTPGMYEFSRFKMLRLGDVQQGHPYERRTIVVDAGQTQRVDLVRSTGHRVQGEVTGLDKTDAPGGFVFVRSTHAAGGAQYERFPLRPCFDVLSFGRDGRFETARLEPGTYTFFAEAYAPEPEEFKHRTGIRLPGYVGAANVTVTAQAPSSPVRIELKPRAGAEAGR